MSNAKKSNRILSALPFRGKRTLIVLICIVLLLCSAYLLVRFEKWRFVNPFAPYEIDNISSATMDEEGNTYVIASSGEDGMPTISTSASGNAGFLGLPYSGS